MPITFSNTSGTGNFTLVNNSNSGQFLMSVSSSSPIISNIGSLNFNGTTTSRLRTSGSSDTTLQFGTGSFTIEWWQNLSSSAGSFPRPFEQFNGPMVSMEGNSASRFFYFWAPSVSYSFGALTSSLNDTWNHFAIVRSGSASGNLKVYRNGV